MTWTVGRLARVALWLVVAVALVLFVRALDWRATWNTVLRASLPLLVAAAVVNLISLALKGVRWWVFLRPSGVSLALATRATFSGAALNNLLIANSGDAARVLFVADATGLSSAPVLATLALERLFDLLGYFVMLLLAGVLLPLPPSLAGLRIGALVALVAISIGLWFVLRSRELAAPAPDATGLRAYVIRTVAGFRAASTAPRFAAAMALALGAWVLQVVTYHLTAMAGGFPASVGNTVVALLAVQIGFAVRATPGGVGVFQLVYAITMAQLGFSRDQATAVAVLIQLQQVLPVTLVGLLLTPADFRVRAAKSA